MSKTESQKMRNLNASLLIPRFLSPLFFSEMVQRQQQQNK